MCLSRPASFSLLEYPGSMPNHLRSNRYYINFKIFVLKVFSGKIKYIIITSKVTIRDPLFYCSGTVSLRRPRKD